MPLRLRRKAEQSNRDTKLVRLRTNTGNEFLLPRLKTRGVQSNDKRYNYSTMVASIFIDVVILARCLLFCLLGNFVLVWNVCIERNVGLSVLPFWCRPTRPQQMNSWRNTTVAHTKWRALIEERRTSLCFSACQLTQVRRRRERGPHCTHRLHQGGWRMTTAENAGRAFAGSAADAGHTLTRSFAPYTFPPPLLRRRLAGGPRPRNPALTIHACLTCWSGPRAPPR